MGRRLDYDLARDELSSGGARTGGWVEDGHRIHHDRVGHRSAPSTSAFRSSEGRDSKKLIDILNNLSLNPSLFARLFIEQSSPEVQVVAWEVFAAMLREWTIGHLITGGLTPQQEAVQENAWRVMGQPAEPEDMFK